MKYYVEYMLRGRNSPSHIYEEYDIIEDISPEKVEEIYKYWDKRGYELLFFTKCEDFKDV